jgi:hypothetical protein
VGQCRWVGSFPPSQTSEQMGGVCPGIVLYFQALQRQAGGPRWLVDMPTEPGTAELDDDV